MKVFLFVVGICGKSIMLSVSNQAACPLPPSCVIHLEQHARAPEKGNHCS